MMSQPEEELKTVVSFYSVLPKEIYGAESPFFSEI